MSRDRGVVSMQDDIDTFNKENGNVTYSVKELIGALHSKLDKMSIDIDTKTEKIYDLNNARYVDCTKRFITKTTYWKMAIIYSGILLPVLGYLVTLHIIS